MPGGDDMVMNMIMLDGALAMASDNSEEMYEKPQGFRAHVETPSRAEFDRVFSALSDRTLRIEMPPGETFWAERFAMFTDRYGTPWMTGLTGIRAPAQSQSRSHCWRNCRRSSQAEESRPHAASLAVKSDLR